MSAHLYFTAAEMLERLGIASTLDPEEYLRLYLDLAKKEKEEEKEKEIEIEREKEKVMPLSKESIEVARSILDSVTEGRRKKKRSKKDTEWPREPKKTADLRRPPRYDYVEVTEAVIHNVHNESGFQAPTIGLTMEDLQTLKNTILTITVSQEKNCLIVRTPYYPEYIAKLKETIGPAFRYWNADIKCWEIAMSEGKKLEKICTLFFKGVKFVNPNSVQKDNKGHRLDRLVRLLNPEAKSFLYKGLMKYYHPDIPKTGDKEISVLINELFK